MRTVLIADDEQNIREGLKCIVDWQSLGFTICGESANGADTLEFILQKNPSLVLLDIRMPRLYGTDIVRMAREGGYRGRFIILSGYSDFAYAQTAIRYGVNFYLTKPIDEDELMQALLKINEILDTEQSGAENLKLIKQKARNVILHELVTGASSSLQKGLSPEDLAEMHLNADVFQVVLYEKFGSGREDACYSFAELLRVTNKENHTFEHFEEDGKDVILLKGSFALLKLQEFLDRYENPDIQEGSPLDSLFLACGRTVRCLDEIHLSYEDACALLKRRFFCQQGQHTLCVGDLPEITGQTGALRPEDLDLYCDRLGGYLLSFNRNRTAETLAQLEDFLYGVKDDIVSVKLFLTDLYLRIREKAVQTYSNVSIPFPTNAEAIRRLEECHYLYEIILFLSGQLTMIMDAVGSPSRDSILDDVLYYIDNNYRSNIKLETIAPLFGYNSAYLGKLFSRAMGENFNSYIDHRRIDYSRELLAEKTLKVYEVARQAGYKNVDYFHKKFRKYVGMSPAEYRKSLAGSADEAQDI